MLERKTASHKLKGNNENWSGNFLKQNILFVSRKSWLPKGRNMTFHDPSFLVTGWRS